MSGLFPSYTGPYTLATRLNGHSDAIYALAISPSREFLASGGRSMISIRHETTRLLSPSLFRQGEDGLRIWDLKSYAQVAWLSRDRSHHGPITCLVWATHQGNSSNILAYGTGLGHLGVWRQSASVRFQQRHYRGFHYLSIGSF
jgi:WD40 repeat protein